MFAGSVGVELGRVRGERGVEADNSAQIAIFDFDQVTRIFRNRRRFRDDHRDRLADVAHAALRQHRMVWLVQLLAVFAGVADGIGHRLETRLARVVAGEYRFDAGMGQGACRVELDDFSVRTIGAQKNRMQLAGKIPIGSVAALTGGQAMIFAARHGGKYA